jgi:hypothetical protein
MEITLTQLYIRKGQLITDMEVMQQQLNIVNQKIHQLKNAEIQLPQVEKKVIPKTEEKR